MAYTGFYIACWAFVLWRVVKCLTRPDKKVSRVVATLQAQHDKAIANVQVLSVTLQNKIDAMAEARALEMRIVDDALLREARAKAVVRVLLQRQNVTEDKIEIVIRSIDGVEEGDI